jgi:dienelactone hydrolase
MRVVGRVFATMLFICLSRAYAEEPLPSQKEYEPPNGIGRVVVVVSGQTGPGNYVGFAKDIAEQGYFAVLVDGNDFWVKDGDRETLLQGVITRAQQSPHALPGKVAVIGFSLGGASSLTYATRIPDLVSAVVAYYPATYYITDPSDFVSRIKVPTLILAGGYDTYKNCCLIETARKLAGAAKASGGKRTLEVVEYPYAGHGFTIRSTRAWRTSDAADAFRLTLAHLRQYSGV